MSKKYANAILSIIRDNPQIKRAAVYNKQLQKLGVDENNVPENLQTAQQVENKVSNFRRGSRGDDMLRPSKRARTE